MSEIKLRSLVLDKEESARCEELNSENIRAFVEKHKEEETPLSAGFRAFAALIKEAAEKGILQVPPVETEEVKPRSSRTLWGDEEELRAVLGQEELEDLMVRGILIEATGEGEEL